MNDFAQQDVHFSFMSRFHLTLIKQALANMIRRSKM